jgi:hypothetical protein
VVERQFAGRETPAAILAVVFVAGEDVPSVEFDLVPGQPVVKKQPDYSRHGNIKIHGRDPIVPVRLESPPELAHLAPAMEIVVGISTLLERDDLGKVAKQQGKRTPGADYANRHIMLVEYKDVTVQTRLVFSSNHICYVVLFVASINCRMENSIKLCIHAPGNVRRPKNPVVVRY